MKAHLLLFFLFLFIACEKTDIDQLQEPDNNSQTGDTQPSVVCPQPCTLYNNTHVIVFSDPLSCDSVALTLISLQEWADLPSANHTDSPNEALLLSESYEEEELDGWHIPTTEEAKRLRSTYSSNTQIFNTDVETVTIAGFTITTTSYPPTTGLTALNAILSSQGAETITLTQGSNNARYLCDGGQKSFSFVSGTSISAAGTKVQHYRLRLVKTIKMQVRE